MSTDNKPQADNSPIPTSDDPGSLSSANVDDTGKEVGMNSGEVIPADNPINRNALQIIIEHATDDSQVEGFRAALVNAVQEAISGVNNQFKVVSESPISRGGGKK